MTPLPHDILKSLPLFLKQAYKFYIGELFSKKFIFLYPESAKRLSPKQLLVHADLVQKARHTNVIFVFDRIESFQRNRLIDRRINFIVPERQLFLPSLLIDLKEFDLKPKPARRLLSSAAQYLLLFHLQHETLEGRSFRELEIHLPYSYQMITLSVRELCSFSLCSLTEGKQKKLIFKESGKSLWQKALPHLSSPVKKLYYSDSQLSDHSMKLSGISALSHYTMISDESMITKAIGAHDFQTLRINNSLGDLHAGEGSYCIQIWKYSPTGLTTTKFVDPLSLYLLFRDTKDERIETAIQAMISEAIGQGEAKQ